MKIRRWWKDKSNAAAGIPEYWIVDPQAKTVTQLVLRTGVYTEQTTAMVGQTLTSAVLDGFTVDIAKMFREAEAGA